MTDVGPNPEATPLELAQAIDATLDAADDALEAGDTEAAAALLTAAEETSDSLLETLGASEPEND